MIMYFICLFLSTWGVMEMSFTDCSFLIIQDLKNIKNVKRCRDGMPKSMQTR